MDPFCSLDNYSGFYQHLKPEHRLISFFHNYTDLRDEFRF